MESCRSGFTTRNSETLASCLNPSLNDGHAWTSSSFDCAVKQWRTRLQTSVKTTGGYFEQKLWRFNRKLELRSADDVKLYYEYCFDCVLTCFMCWRYWCIYQLLTFVFVRILIHHFRSCHYNSYLFPTSIFRAKILTKCLRIALSSLELYCKRKGCLIYLNIV